MRAQVGIYFWFHLVPDLRRSKKKILWCGHLTAPYCQNFWIMTVALTPNNESNYIFRPNRFWSSDCPRWTKKADPLVENTFLLQSCNIHCTQSRQKGIPQWTVTTLRTVFRVFNLVIKLAPKTFTFGFFPLQTPRRESSPTSHHFAFSEKEHLQLKVFCFMRRWVKSIYSFLVEQIPSVCSLSSQQFKSFTTVEKAEQTWHVLTHAPASGAVGSNM